MHGELGSEDVAECSLRSKILQLAGPLAWLTLEALG
jgi:hypothetical protein